MEQRYGVGFTPFNLIGFSQPPLRRTDRRTRPLNAPYFFDAKAPLTVLATPFLGWLIAATAGLAQAQTPPASLGNAPEAVQMAADTRLPLTLEKALAWALEGHGELIAASREVDATQGQVIQGMARRNPELAYALEDQRAPTRVQSVQINWPVELGGKRAARMAAAERGRELAIENLNLRRIEIRAAVVTTFFETLAAQDRTELAQASLQLALRASDAASKRVAAGKISPMEEVKAQVAEAGVRVELVQAQSEQRSARLRLASLLGVQAPAFAQVVGQTEGLPPIPTQGSVLQRLASSPALVRAQLEVDRRKSLVDVERSKQTPDVTFSMGMKRPNEIVRNQVLVGVSVPLQLFDQNQGNVLEALKREEKARDELQALNERLQAEVLQARERLESVHQEAAILAQRVLPAALSAYQAATLGFEHGKFGFMEVLDAQRTYFAAKSQYLKTLLEAHRAAADMDRVLGPAPLTPPSAAQQPATH